MRKCKIYEQEEEKKERERRKRLLNTTALQTFDYIIVSFSHFFSCERHYEGEIECVYMHIDDDDRHFSSLDLHNQVDSSSRQFSELA